MRCARHPSDLRFVEEFEVRGREARDARLLDPRSARLTGRMTAEAAAPAVITGAAAPRPLSRHATDTGAASPATTLQRNDLGRGLRGVLRQPSGRRLPAADRLAGDAQARRAGSRPGRAAGAVLAHVHLPAARTCPPSSGSRSSLGWTTLVIVAAISLPHVIQDDGRLLLIYVRRVKGTRPGRQPHDRGDRRPGVPHGRVASAPRCSSRP